jgi:hypothetical protein
MAASAPSQYESCAPPRSSHVHSTSQPFDSLLNLSPQNTYSTSSQGSPNNLTDISLSSPSPLASSLDLSPQDGHTRNRLLKDSIFPSLKDDAALLDSLEHLQAQDPLGTQIWRLFSNTKAQLPNSDRFQNIPWRMMHMNLKKLEAQNPRLVFIVISSSQPPTPPHLALL